MANFRGMQLTALGRGLMAKLMVSELPTVLTRVALGSGILPEGQQLEDLKALISEHTSLPITTKTIIGSEVVQLETKFKSASFPSAVKLHEIGVFATDPDTGEELLYAVDNAADGDTIPAYGGGTFVIRTFRILLQVAAAANVSFQIDSDVGIYSLGKRQETRISTAGQTTFTLATVNSKGALDIFVEGAWTNEWTSPDGKNQVVLGFAIPAGREVVFSETVLREATE